MKLKDIKLSIYMFIFSCLTILSYIVKHFSSDTFIITRLGYKGYAINYSWLDGRFFMGCISMIADKLNIPILTYNRIMLILAIFISVIAVIKLRNIVLKYKDIKGKTSNFLLIVACYYSIFHFFYIENLYFVEGLVMALSILFYTIAADLIVDNKKYIKAFVFMVLGILSYQATISMFYICVILFSMLKEESCKSICKNLLKSIALGALAVAVNFLEILIVQEMFGIEQDRISGNIFANIILCTFYVWKVVTLTAYKFPKYLFLLFIVIIEIVVYYNTFKYNKNKKGEVFLIEQLTLIVLSIAFSFIPSIITLSAFFSGRLRFSVGATIGILFIHMLAKSDFINNKKTGGKILAIILIAYAVINSVNYIYLTELNRKSNELDEKYVNEIGAYISEYEKENNVKVSNITLIIEENNVKKYYDEIKQKNIDFTINTSRIEWAVDGIINYYTGRNLKRIEITEKEAELYYETVDRQKDYICIGDTLYISIYHK